jgi:hypothetical protein
VFSKLALRAKVGLLNIEVTLKGTTKGDLINQISMEQHALKNVDNDLNTNIYSYLETSGGQSSSTYFNVVHFFNTSVH